MYIQTGQSPRELTKFSENLLHQLNLRFIALSGFSIKVNIRQILKLLNCTEKFFLATYSYNVTYLL